MKTKKLLDFTVAKDGRHFVISGGYEMEDDKDEMGNAYVRPEFDITAVMEQADGSYTPYTPETCTWAGVPFTVNDMAWDVLFGLTAGSSLLNVRYIEPGLATYVSSLKADTVLDGVPKRLVKDWRCYTVIVVTDEYIYYADADNILMLNAKTREVVSDNYFSEVGLYKSAENVRGGKEKLLYGTLPEE